MREKFLSVEDFRRMDKCTKGLFGTTLAITILEIIFYLVIPTCGQIFINLDIHLGLTGIVIWWSTACVLMALVILDLLFLLRKEKAGKLGKLCVAIRFIKVAIALAILGHFIYLIKTVDVDSWIVRLDDLFKNLVDQDEDPEVQKADVQKLRRFFIALAAITIPTSITKCILQFLLWRNRQESNSLEAQKDQEMRKSLTENADVPDGPEQSVVSAITTIDNQIQTYELDGKKPWIELKEEIRQKTNVQNNGNNNVHQNH